MNEPTIDDILAPKPEIRLASMPTPPAKASPWKRLSNIYWRGSKLRQVRNSYKHEKT